MTPTTTHRWSPVLVATVRGVALAAASAVLGTLVIVLGQVKAEALVPLVPPWLLLLRYLEGVVDKARGQLDQVPGGGAVAPVVELEQVDAIADALVAQGWQPPRRVGELRDAAGNLVEPASPGKPGRTAAAKSPKPKPAPRSGRARR